MNAFTSDRWSQVWRNAGMTGDASPWFERIGNAYNEPGRFYHTQLHIAECLTALDTVPHLAHNAVAVELAIWFHDVVYDSRSTDNEERSAAIAVHCLSQNEAAESLLDPVHRLVAVTKEHSLTDDPDASLILDIDLSILGQGEERFHQYDHDIHREFSWVPQEIYQKKRAEVLQGFLNRRSIYQTHEFAVRFERQARHNLKQAIHRLRKELV